MFALIVLEALGSRQALQLGHRLQLVQHHLLVRLRLLQLPQKLRFYFLEVLCVFENLLDLVSLFR